MNSKEILLKKVRPLSRDFNLKALAKRSDLSKNIYVLFAIA